MQRPGDTCVSSSRTPSCGTCVSHPQTLKTQHRNTTPLTWLPVILQSLIPMRLLPVKSPKCAPMTGLVGLSRIQTLLQANRREEGICGIHNVFSRHRDANSMRSGETHGTADWCV